VPVLRYLPTWTVLLPLAAAGLVISLPAWRDLPPLHVIAVSYTATALLFFNFARFPTPLLPLPAVSARAAPTELPGLPSRRSRPARVVALAAAGAAFLLAAAPLSRDPLHNGQSAAQLADLMLKAGRFEEALAQSDAAISLLEPIYVSAGGRLGEGGHGVVRVS